MYEKVCEILSNYVEAPEGGLKPETKFVDDLGMNSLSVMSLIGDIEDEFNVEIDTNDLRSIFTINDLVDYLKKLA